MDAPGIRLSAVLNGEKPDHLPWFADLSYWHYVMWITGRLESKYHEFEGLIELHRDLGAGFYYPGYYPYIPAYKNCEVIETEKEIGVYSRFYRGTAYSDTIYKGEKKSVIKIKKKGNNDLFREVITPLGSIKERWAFAQTSFSWSPEEYFIKSHEDLEILRYWLENTFYEPDYSTLLSVKKIIGDQGCIVCNLNKSPLMDFIHWYAGIMTTMNIMMDHKNLFVDTLEILEDKARDAIEIASESPGDILLIPDNLHSDLVGKNLYNEFLRSHYEKQVKITEGAGKFSSIHMDGGLKGLLKEISKTGFSIIEALTPKPAGDLMFDEIIEYVDNRAIIWGGIPGTLFTPSTSEEDFEEYVKKIISKMTAKPQFVLGIADQIPPDGIIDRIKKVTELVEKYGTYKNL